MRLSPGQSLYFLIAAIFVSACSGGAIESGSPGGVSVSISPLSAVIQPRANFTFTATVSGVSQGQSTAVTWSVQEGASGGAVDGSGKYTAPATEGNYHVIATSVADPSRLATATVAVSAFTALSADRRTVWNPGLNSVGGVPNRTTICANINASTYGNGTQDATAGIQSAINACPLGQVVQLSAGTFTINNDIVFVNRGITLRGAGPTSTLLRRTNGARQGDYHPYAMLPVVIVGPVRYPTSAPTGYNFAADGVKGSYSVQLTANANLSPGQIVLIDELSGAAWQTDPAGRGQIWAAPDWRVTYQRHNPAQPSIDDPWPDVSTWFSRADRVTAEVKEVQTYNPSTFTVTFTTPFHITYRASHTAQLAVYPDTHVKNAGLEDVKVTGGDDGNIRFLWAAYSWVARVESTGFLNQGFGIDNSFRVEIRDSFVHTPVWMEPGGGSYNLSVGNGSAEFLIENNIMVDADKAAGVVQCSGAGAVFGYNYTDDSHIGSNPGWVEIGLNASHLAGSHHTLFEGNYAFNWDSDDTHGSSVYHTVFRNHLSGFRRNFPVGGPARCAGAMYYSYWMSFVGNVLGLQGQMAGWVADPNATWPSSNPTVWNLGWDGYSPYPVDAQVQATALRHGNFDYVTSSVTWDPNTSEHTLPNSLYLSQRPAFFNAGRGYVWPWVDPLGATKLYTLPAKARYDAGTPFIQP